MNPESRRDRNIAEGPLPAVCGETRSSTYVAMHFAGGHITVHKNKFMTSAEHVRIYFIHNYDA